MYTCMSSTVSVYVVNLVQTLPSSDMDVCPGEKVVFTCETNDAVGLVWDIPSFTSVAFQNPLQINQTVERGRFTLILTDITEDGSTFISTATLENAAVYDDQTEITCSDGDIDLSKQVNITGMSLASVVEIPVIWTNGYVLYL